MGYSDITLCVITLEKKREKEREFVRDWERKWKRIDRVGVLGGKVLSKPNPKTFSCSN
jgi:hypothetical protein